MSIYDDSIYEVVSPRRINATGWSDYKIKLNPVTDIVTAEETRQRQKELAQEEILSQLNSIFAKINSTYSSNYVIIYSRPHEKVKEKLLDLGYTLKESETQREGYTLTISW